MGGETIKLKILEIVIILIIVSSTFISSANVKNKNDIENTSTNDDVVEIRVAIYTDEKETDPGFYGPCGRTRYYMWTLKDYCWKVGNKTYCFLPTLLSTENILRGELTTDDYDVLIYEPNTATQGMFYTGLYRLPKNKIRVRNIVNFVKDGGGYYSSCVGSAISGNMINEPKTFQERMMKKSCMGISAVNINFSGAIPVLSQLPGLGPGAIGIGAYVMYSGFDQDNYSVNYYNGACLDYTISKNNPIFDDFIEDTRKIRWSGGPELVIPENPDREIMVLARWPNEEMSENETTQIHAWEYTGGIRGMISGFCSRIIDKDKIHYFDNLGIFWALLAFAEDWVDTGKVIDTHFSNTPFITAEVYPNENKARIVRCTGSCEYNVWWGGHTNETEDTGHNNMFDGLHHWVDVIPENETVEDDFSYNYWIGRRIIAWSSQKVPDNDLPPSYGPSQVSDIYPYNQSSNFKIFCNSELSDGIESLDLFYRYSENNSFWSPWNLYDTDSDISNGWSWEFNAPNGVGYYEFYSIRHVQINEYEWLNETAPPGPDAIARVVD